MPLTRLVRPHIAIITTIAPVHLGFFRSVEAIADAKAEIFEGLEQGGAAILNATIRISSGSRRHALQHGAQVVAFGEAARRRRAAARLSSSSPTAPTVTADILGESVDYRDRRAGRHSVLNTLAVLAAVKLAGADLDAAAAALAGLRAQTGRGARTRDRGKDGTARHDRRDLQRQPRLDARGAAVLG